MKKILLATLGLLTASPAAAQMSLPGSFEVSETGAAVYTVPIAVPPGTAGLEPKLTLQYNSRSGNGLLSVGWSLGGLPAIVRCPKTIAQDGARGGINYDANDRFCLEGERLVAISGTYGADSTEYRTEREGFSKIVSYGSAGTGPAWFKVWTKAGQILEFGNTADSRIEAQGKTTARLWTVNKVNDTAGNDLTVTYAEDNTNGEYRPTRIDYTGNAAASVSPYASVRFVYETRPATDQTPLYEAGSLIKTTLRLSKVQTFVAETLVRDYRLSYEQSSSTQRSMLTSLTVCVGGDSCLPPTNLAVTNGSAPSPGDFFEDVAPLFTATTNVAGIDGAYGAQMSGPHILDYNGDGKADFLFFFPGNNGVHIRLSQGDGTFTYFGVRLGGAWGKSWIPYIGDFNGDGKSDLLWADTAQGYRRLWLNLGGSPSLGDFVEDATTLFAETVNVAGKDGFLTSYLPHLGDFNGDGKTDILWNFAASQYAGYRQLWLSQGDGTFTEILNVANLDGAYGAQMSGPHILDYNGDGKADFLFFFPGNNGIHIRLSQGDGTFVYFGVRLGGTWGNSWTPYIADFNSDGKPDIFWSYAASQSAGYRRLWLNRGAIPNPDDFIEDAATLFAETVNVAGIDGAYGAQMSGPHILDYNGDGKADFLFFYPDNNGVHIRFGHGDGTFIYTGARLGGVWGNGWTPYIADFNGDGKPDILWNYAASQYAGYRQMWRTDGVSNDTVSSATSGLGAVSSLTYKSLAQSSAPYIKDAGGSACAYPCVDLQGPIYVVSQVQTTNGVGGTYTSSYKYAGAKADQSGRGFLGFRQVTVKDEQTLVEQATEYLQSWPFVGLTGKRTKTRSTVELNRTENTYASDDLGSGRRFVKLTQSMESSKELTGTSLPTVTTAYQYDSYGNATQVQVSTGDGHSKTTVNTYANDIANWFLGRLTRAEVTSVAP